MNFQTFLKRSFFAGCMLAATSAIIVFGQTPKATPTLVMGEAAKPKAIAGNTNLYCAGFIQQSAMATGNRIIGGSTEAETYNFDEKDLLYINMGSDKGVNVGDTFAVVRPRGEVNSRWSNKTDLGFYVQELGMVEVVRVKAGHSVVRIKVSCDSIHVGDIVQLTAKRMSPIANLGHQLDQFADPSGKARGRILMSRDGAELLGRDFIAYVDLGMDDNTQIGDRLTVYRPLGKGNITQIPQKESVSARDEGFQSDVYRGGKFSNQAQRRDGDKAEGRVVTSSKAKSSRPELRKVVGEAVVLNVKERTATIVITKTAQEVHTGDWVEIQ